jgi:UDPglucose 6-dehydrogenase
MNIAVVGTGYVGLVTGTCFAENGNHVTCVDIDANKVEKMKNGIIPIYEPHLDVLFERNIKQNRLVFTTNLEEAIKDATIIFLALPTPPGEDVLLSKNYPTLLGPSEYDRGFEDGYDRALEVLQEYINGPTEAEPVVVEEVEDDFDITDVDDPE